MANLLPDDSLDLWAKNVSSTEQYRTSDPAQQAAVQDAYFDKYIKPNVDANTQPDAYNQFLQANTPVADLHVDPKFLFADDSTRKDILANNLRAGGVDPNTPVRAEANQLGPITLPGSHTLTALDQAYQNWKDDPSVQALHAKAEELSLTSPLTGLAQLPAMAESALGDNTLATNVAKEVNQKNVLQQIFPQTKYTEAGAQLGVGLLGGALIVEGTAAAEGAGFLGKAMAFGKNVAGQSALQTATTPVSINSNSQTPGQDLAAAKASQFVGDAGINTVINAVIPGASAVKGAFKKSTSSETEAISNLNTVTKSYAEGLGISPKQVQQNLQSDIKTALSNGKGEVTPAAVAASNTPTSQISSQVLTDWLGNASTSKVSTATKQFARTAFIQDEASNAKAVFNQKLADQNKGATYINDANRLASEPAKDIEAYSAGKPITDYKSTLDDIHNATADNTVSMQHPEYQAALKSSPTIQAMQAKIADDLEIPDEFKNLNPAAQAQIKAQLNTKAPESMDYIQLNNHIKSLDNEISVAMDLKDNTRVDALKTAQNRLDLMKQEALNNDPALLKKVNKFNNAASEDRNVDRWTNLIKTVDPTNGLDAEGNVSKNLSIQNTQKALKDFGSLKALAAAKKDMTPDEFVSWQSSIDKLRATERANNLSGNLNSGEDSVKSKATNAAAQQILSAHAPTAAITNTIGAARFYLRGKYRSLINDAFNDPDVAAKLVGKTLNKNASLSEYQELYNQAIKPGINAFADPIAAKASGDSSTANPIKILLSPGKDAEGNPTLTKETPLANKTTVKASPIEAALIKNGLDPKDASYGAKVMGVESTYGKNTAGLAASKAEGLTQFYPQAKKEVETKVGHKLNLNDPNDAIVAAVAYKNINKERLAKAGITNPTDADMYAAHHLGADGFITLKKAVSQQTPAANLVTPAAFKGNKAVFLDSKGNYRTPAQVLQAIHKMYNKQETSAQAYLKSSA